MEQSTQYFEKEAMPDIETRLKEAEKHIGTLARTLTATVTIVNLLIKKIGMNKDEFQAALTEAAIDSVTSEFVQPEGTRPISGDSRIVDTGVPNGSDNGAAERVESSDSGSKEEKASNGDQSPSDGSPKT